MNSDRLNEIQQRLHNLDSQFPWDVVPPKVSGEAWASVVDANGRDVATDATDYDAEFIAHAALDVADLLHEIKFLRGIASGVRDEYAPGANLDDWLNWHR